MTRPYDPHAGGQLAFQQSRQAVIIVAPDAPDWTIVDVNAAYLAVTHRRREELMGRPLFAAFPESMETTQEHGSHRIALSLERALLGQTTVLPVQRYDLPVAGEPGRFEEHYWELSSAPLLSDDGTVLAVLHEVLNVTARERAELERRRLAAALEERNAQLLDQGRELELTNQQLQENAVELEVQAQTLQDTAARMEEHAREAERARGDAEQAERQLQVVFAQAPAAVAVTVGPEHRFVLANRGYERLVGRTVPVGQLFSEVLPELVNQGYTRLLDRVYTTGVPYVATGEFARIDRGGAELEDGWFDFVYQPLLDGDGTVTGVLQQGIDVTARVRAEAASRESEEYIRALADAIPTLAWTARADGSVEWYNKQWYAYTGATPAQVEGWGWQILHHPDTLPHVLEEWTRSIETGEPFEMTFPLRGADGVYRPFLTRVAAARNASGEIVRWFGTNTNVEVEHTARRQAEEANAAKTTFLATMSHELRTPLNALGGYLDLLLMELRGPLTAEQRLDLQRMMRSHRHLLGLINDILNFAKIDTGHAEFSIAPTDVGDVLRRVEELISPQCVAKSIVCQLEIPADPLIALADDERLGQIILNLLGNAVKYTPVGGRVTAAWHRDGDNLCLEVRDTGIGIPASQLDAIFNPFVQVGRRLNAPGEGVGLGLAISRTLAEGMRGALSVQSTVGEGSTFTLRVPAAR